MWCRTAKTCLKCRTGAGAEIIAKTAKIAKIAEIGTILPRRTEASFQKLSKFKGKTTAIWRMNADRKVSFHPNESLNWQFLAICYSQSPIFV